MEGLRNRIEALGERGIRRKWYKYFWYSRLGLGCVYLDCKELAEEKYALLS